MDKGDAFTVVFFFSFLYKVKKKLINLEHRTDKIEQIFKEMGNSL